MTTTTQFPVATELDRLCVDTIRMLSIDAVEQAKSRCRWVGEAGEAIGMHSFGASGPAGALYKDFGLTPERVALAGRRSVRRARERVCVR